MAEEAAVRREAVPMSVLIVDDEQTVRETCGAVAAQSGMKTIAVATAEEALEVLGFEELVRAVVGRRKSVWHISCMSQADGETSHWRET